MTKQNQDYCLATVTSPNYIVGTLVMLNSFLMNNRWFKGDILIIHDLLPEKWRKLLGCFSNIKFQQISNQIKRKVNDLNCKLPHLKLNHKVSRFYSLELFRDLAPTYKKILFCDSDILFLGGIREIFELEDKIYCCGDKHYYTNTSIDIKTYTPYADCFSEKKNPEVLNSTFNAGFIFFGNGTISRKDWNNILDLLETKIWNSIQAPYTDQIIFNIYFKGNHNIINPKYNFLIAHKDLIKARAEIPPEDIKVLHFNGKTKPWDNVKILETTAEDSSNLEFFRLWYKAYLDFLPEINLRYKFNQNRYRFHDK